MSKKEKDRIIICPSCGGDFSNSEAKCPFCGTMNPEGAERAFMNELGQIKADISELPDDVQGEVDEGIKDNSRKMVKIAVIVLISIFVIVLIGKGITKISVNREIDEYRAEENFKKVHFPELNRLYEERNPDALMDYALNLLDDSGYGAIFSWNHYGYLDSYLNYCHLKDTDEYMKEENLDLDSTVVAVRCALELSYISHTRQYLHTDFSSEDLEDLEGYKEYALDFLRRVLGMTSEEVDAFAKDIIGNQPYVDHFKLEKALKKIMKR